MIALIIIGLIFLTVAYFMGTDAIEKQNPKREWPFFLLFVLGVVLAANGLQFKTEKETYRKALEHNPYKKEYIYKQTDSTYVIIDSVYVKKEEK